MICCACSGTLFRDFAVRADGMQIVQCCECGLGVVGRMPDSTAAFYADGYYGNASGTGYDDYGFMAEHGLGWAAAMVGLMFDGGRILDIGCADGYLLEKLGPGFEKFGIEANATAAGQAQAKGVRILENDLLASSFAREWPSAFDVVTAIAVFEHLLDFRRGFEAAIGALKGDGALLFEVPLMSSSHSNAAWMKGSFEHIFYPTEASIRYVVETALGCRLVGSEVVIRDYGSTYVGLVTRSAARSASLGELLERVMASDFAHGSDAETAAATQLHLLHAANSTEATVSALARLPVDGVNRPLLARIGQLWSFDIERLRASELRAAQAEAEARASQAAAAKLEEMRWHVAAVTHRIRAIEGSTIWRATGPLRRIGSLSPKLAKRLNQLAKLVWWTAQGTLLDHLREYRRKRAAAIVETEAAESSSRVELLADTGVVAGEADPPADQPWPSDRPLVSVVIPCFNYGHLVEEAIESVFAQTFVDLEIIVVEGGSTSAESRALLAAATSKADPSRLRVIWQDRPHRAGANRNTGISHARGKYICCLDADDRLAPTYIEKAVFVLDEGYDVVSPALRFFGKRFEVWAPQERPTLDMLLEGNQVLTCALFRKALWKASGGYRDSDPATGHLHEDWLFWVRLAALGARFLNLREPLFHYRSHEGTLSNSKSVLDLRDQRLEVRRLNSDVLTPEAIARAREQSGPAPLPPQAFRQARRHEVAASTGPTLLLAMPYLVLGGAERLLSAIVGHLVKSGWRVVVVTTVAVDESHGDTTDWFEAATPEIFHLPRFLEAARWKDFVAHIFASRQIDLVWVAGSAFFYDCLPALRLRNPHLRVADLLFNTLGHTANNRRYADCIDLTFVENTEVRDWLLAAGERPDRICLVESGVDLIENAPAKDRAAVRKDYALPLDTVLVGFFGRWSEEKDPLGFVEIAKRVPAELKVSFVMTGAGPLETELRKAIAAAGFPPGRFMLKGAVSDLKPYLRASDVLVLPSRLDGRPNVVMEALASGVAVVASQVGALPEMFEASRQGHLCPVGDYDCFAQRIVELASDKDMLKRFKRDARSFAERRLDIRTMLEAYEHRVRALIQST
ncbi:glycosyltransferase [Variovorax sp. M-6]|uniref:glycosyltransferase n=1 Tax=Variovorax sp. M-6 TaxID=3233041 RepID=UPI003F996514